MIAHQRVIREAKIIDDPRPVNASLEGYSIETISRADAVPLILHYEWLGNVGRAVHFVGLMSPTHELHGVACFGYGPAGPIRTLIGKPALCLERGACVHYAPANAASFLITGACKLIYRITGIGRFFAYADPMAGEYGGVYQAANWVYLGQGLNGGKGRAVRYSVLPPGADRNDHTVWQTTRALRRGPKEGWLTFEQARKAGWEIGNQPAKHVYAINVGRDRRKWRKAMKQLPYPAPQAELKRSVKSRPIFTIVSPESVQPFLI
jgi:hypothetical protein